MSAPTVTLSIPDLPDGADTLTVALALAACGTYVGPALRGSKNPGSILGKRWQDQTSRDPQQITAWFAGTDHDLFIHCGRSGLVLLDVDRPDELPSGWKQHLNDAPYQPTRPDTPDRGHYVFAMPPGRIIGNPDFPGGEVRGLNGVIMVYPSHHCDGGQYGPWLRTGAVPVLPDVIAKTMPEASAAEDAATDAQVDAFLAAHTAATRPEVLDGLKKALANKFAAKLSRHGSTVPVLAGALKEARAGYYPAMTAYDTIRPMFLAEVAKPSASKHQGHARTGRKAESEFYGILAWAVGQANAADLDEIRTRTEAKMPDNTSWMHNITGSTATQTRVRTAKHSGHLGWATKLAAHDKGGLLFVNGVGWHRWDGKRFAKDADGAARRRVHAMLKRERQAVLNRNLSNEDEEKALNAIARYETTSAITGILTEAAALQEFSIVADDLDADPWLFNCQNGTLDLRTMVLGPHDPADRISKVANAAYDPKAGGTQWTEFLVKVLPLDEVRDYLQRLTGLSLLGEVNGDKQIAPIAYGAGANGKTTFIETACFAMGDYAMTAEPTLLLSKRGEVHPTGVADLLGKRLVSTTETQQGARFDIALLKRLTGGDTLKARWMRQDFFEFKPSHLLLMCTNHLPEVDDGSEAVWRRIRLIPFTVEIPKADRDEGLKDKLQAEADAVLSWIISGWADYRTSGLAEPDAVLAATKDYQAESDAVGRFITEECLTGAAIAPYRPVNTSELHQAWEPWAAKNGCLPMSMKAFGHELDIKGYPADQKAYRRPRIGICLRPVNFFKGAGQ